MAEALQPVSADELADLAYFIARLRAGLPASRSLISRLISVGVAVTKNLTP